MSSKVVCIREALYSAIRSVCSVSWLFARAPGHDFTRNGKLPLEKLITLILSLKGGSLASELLGHFGCSAAIASAPAFVKRRGRLLPEAFSFLFHLFVERTQPSTLFHGFCLPAVDGSDLHIPTDSDDTDSFFLKNKKSVLVPPFHIPFRVVRFKLSDSSVETVITNLDFSPNMPIPQTLLSLSIFAGNSSLLMCLRPMLKLLFAEMSLPFAQVDPACEFRVLSTLSVSLIEWHKSLRLNRLFCRSFDLLSCHALF